MIRNILKGILMLGGSSGKLERAIAPLRKYIDDKSLIQWNSEELNLLSLQVEHKTKKSFFNSFVSGNFKTIYAESVGAYAYKDVYTGTKRGLILVKTVANEYVYTLTQGVAQVYIDGRHKGVIDYQGRLVSRRGSVLGQIEQGGTNMSQIIVEGKKIGSFNKPKPDAALHERALELYKDTGKTDKQILISLVLFEILKRNV